MTEHSTICPHCNTAWLYASLGDYTSGYESYGYKINCTCGFAWKNTQWKHTKDEAIKTWNEIALKESEE